MRPFGPWTKPLHPRDSHEMRSGLLIGLRGSRFVARWLAALLVLPMLLGVLPPAAVPTEEALARDLALSVCTPNGGEDRGTPPASHDRQCVLCTMGCAFAAPLLADRAGAALAPAPLVLSLRALFGA